MGTFLKRIGLLYLVIIVGATFADAQNVQLRPPVQINAEGGFDAKLLFKRDRALRFIYNTDLSGQSAVLKIGNVSNTYKTTEFSISGTLADITPSTVGLKPGKYFARISNSEFKEFSNIKNDPKSNLIYSNEIQFIVEATTAPKVVAPRGPIETPTPRFEWEGVEGVKSYWIILSSTPFDIATNDDGDISIEGANLVWQYITSETSAQYGAINNNTPYRDEAPPLNPNKEYSYTILNLFEEDNPVFASAVFGGIVPFTYEVENPLPAPTIISPSTNTVFDGDENITFRWTEVPEARNYSVNLYEVITQQGVDASIPIWSVTTSNAIVDYPALGSLKNSTYKWNVVAYDNSGGGTTSGTAESPTNSFDYNIPLGSFVIYAKSSVDNSSLIGLEVDVRAISGGVTPNLPVFVQSSSVTDNLVTGTYEFTAKKDGYKDLVKTVVINEDRETNVTFVMESLPASLSGVVQDQTSVGIKEAIVKLTNIVSGVSFSTKTVSNGSFNVGVPEGTYAMSISRKGYKVLNAGTVTLGIDEQKIINTPYQLEKFKEIISGYVQNELGIGISLAKVLAKNSNGEVIELRSNGEGYYRVSVSPDNWVLTASKSGFVLNNSKNISISQGQNLENQNINMVSAANQVSGFVREIIIGEDGGVGYAPLSGVQVRAIPSSGDVVYANSGNNGSYSLDLKAGSYTLSALLKGYESSDQVEITLGNGETVNGVNMNLTEKTSTVTGRILTADGSGISGATITVEGEQSQIVTSRAGGYYNISLSSGTHTLRAKLPGYTSEGSKQISLNAGQSLSGINFKLTPNAVVIKGSVKSGGSSLAFSTIYAENSAGVITEEKTNETGSYVLSLKPGEWKIAASKYGFKRSATQTVNLDAGQEVQGVTFNLVSNTRTISGRVNGSGSPLRNAQALLLNSAGEDLKDTQTKVDGTFSFSAETDQSYFIVVKSDGYNTQRDTITNLQASAESFPVSFDLQTSPALVKGKIVTIAGSPIKDAKVELYKAGNLVSTLNTDFNGVYSVGIDAGDYLVNATRKGYSQKSQSISLNFGETREGVGFTLSENYALYRGQVTESDGSPVAGALVGLTSSGQGYSTRTDDNGNYTLTKIVGSTYKLTVSLEGYDGIEESNIQIPSGGNIEKNITLVSRQGVIKGSVKSVQNQSGIAVATVTALSSDGESYTTTTNERGEYTLSNLAYSTYTLSVAKSGYQFTEDIETIVNSETPTKEGVDLQIEFKVGVITGIITDGNTEVAVGSADIIAVGPGTDRAISNNNGAFSITGLSVGTYEVSVVKSEYATINQSVTITSTDFEKSLNIEIIQNTGAITGRILNQNGTSLNRLIPVRAISEENTFETLTDINGNFTFSGIPKGYTYSIETATSSEGLINSEVEVVFNESDGDIAVNSGLVIQQNTSSIAGNAGIANASVQLYNSNNELIRTKTSEPDGSFRFQFLSVGDFVVKFNASGYVFDRSSVEIQNLGFAQTETVVVGAIENNSDIQVTLKSSTGSALSGGTVVLLSEDQSSRITKVSGNDGLVLIESVDASKTYRIFASKDGYTLSGTLPESISLTAGSTYSIDIQLNRNDFNLYGIVNRSDNGAALSNAEVVLTATDGTFQQTGTTNNNGEYFFPQIARNTYLLRVNRLNFSQDSLTFSIEDLPIQEKSYEDSTYSFSTANTLSLTPAFVDLLGRVVNNLGGVQNSSIKVTSSTEVQGVTNSNGNYSLTVPVNFGTSDTIAVNIEMSYESVTIVKNQLIIRANLGNRVNVSNFIIPSGRISGTLSDGSSAISGVEITVERPGNATPINLLTDSEGAFQTDSTLKSGIYSVTVNSKEYLAPASEIDLNLEADTSRIDAELMLPFKFTAPDTIQAANETSFAISVNQGIDESNITEAYFLYKGTNESEYDTLNFTYSDGELTTILPAQNKLEPIQFYTEVSTNQDSSMTYQSLIYERELGAKGLLDKILLQPVVNNLALRTNDVYELDVFVQDGSNNIMSQFEAGEIGTIELLESSEGISLLVNDEAKTITLETGSEEVNGSFLLSAKLGSQQIVTSFSVNIQEIEVGELSIQDVDGGIMSNDEPYSFGMSAQDSSGNRVILGNALKWQVEPAYLGEITNTGVFTPTENSIGQFKVVVVDESSGKIDSSDTFGLFANVSPDETVVLNSGSNLELTFPQGALGANGTVKLSQRQPETPKQFVVPLNSDKSFKSSNTLFNITLEGTELVQSASLKLNPGTEFKLNNGLLHLAHFDEEQLQWELLNTTIDSDSFVSTNEVTSFSQFAILVENQPLGIEYFAVLPNPFSPEVAPAKIGYQLNSQNPPAYVTIHIYNMRGELVRTLLDRDPQMPGIYGSSAGEKIIEWNGLTDDGKRARNGRYAVQIIIEDSVDKKKYLKSLVLIK